MTAFEPGLSGVAASAERLQIGRIKGPIRAQTHRLDMVDLQPPARPAAAAFPAVPLKDGMTQHLPTAGGGDALGMAGIFPHSHVARAFLIGAAFIRAPCATASTDAAAASIRPRDRAFASL